MTPLFDDQTTRVLFAVLDGKNSVRDIQAATGIKSTQTVYVRLQALQRAGLVDWTPNTHRTLRPTSRPVWAP